MSVLGASAAGRWVMSATSASALRCSKVRTGSKAISSPSILVLIAPRAILTRSPATWSSSACKTTMPHEASNTLAERRTLCRSMRLIPSSARRRSSPAATVFLNSSWPCQPPSANNSCWSCVLIGARWCDSATIPPCSAEICPSCTAASTAGMAASPSAALASWRAL